jgi:hypothetical protein
LGVGLFMNEADPKNVDPDNADNADNVDVVEEVNGEPAGIGRAPEVGSLADTMLPTIGMGGGKPRIGTVQGALDGWVLVGGLSVNVTGSNARPP